MVDIGTFTKAGSMYIKADEVKKYPTIVFVITQEPVLVESEFEGKKQPKLHCEGEFNKEARQMDMSKTNARIIEKILGTDTKKWIGASLELTTYQTMSSKGKLIDAILVKGVRM